jgi:hypothetical protein
MHIVTPEGLLRAVAISSALVLGLAALVSRAAEALGGRDRVMALKTLQIKVGANLAVHSQKPLPLAEVVSAIERQVRNAQACCRRAAEAQFFQPGCPIQYNRPLPPVSN